MITEEKIRELSNQFMNGWQQKDKEFLQEIIADDFILLSHMAKDGKANKTMFLQMLLKIYDLSFFEYRFTHLIIEQEQVISSSILTVIISQGGVGDTGKNKYLLTDIWKIKNGNWRLFYRHATYSTLLN